MSRTVLTTSLLDAPPAAVWAHASTMEGVNEELAPWLHMSFPREAAGRRLAPEDAGHPLFTSTLRLLGALPYDRHSLRLIRVTPGEGFLEDSTSWTMRVWQHERTLAPVGAGTEITDRVTFAARIASAEPLVERIVRAVFRHRHAVLRRRFGER